MSTIRSPYFSPIAGLAPVPELPARRESTENTKYKDPLFRYYFRAFHRLYHQLSTLKPVLIQDAVADDPWKLLIAVTLLNKTSGRLAIPVFWEIINKWSTPWALSQVNETELSVLLRPLGTQTIRAKRIINLSRIFLQDPPKPSDLRPSRSMRPSNLSLRRDKYPPTPISHLPGAGPYALDSYRVFCTTSENPFSEEWKAVMPSDKELIRYLKWKWAFMERKEWDPNIGVIGPVDLPYLRSLVVWLAQAKAANDAQHENLA